MIIFPFSTTITDDIGTYIWSLIDKVTLPRGTRSQQQLMTFVGLVSHWYCQPQQQLGRVGLSLFPQHLVVVNLLYCSCKQQNSNHQCQKSVSFWRTGTLLFGSGLTRWENVTWIPQHIFHILSALSGESHQHLKRVWSAIPWFKPPSALANIGFMIHACMLSTSSKSPQSSRASCVWEPPS